MDKLDLMLEIQSKRINSLIGMVDYAKKIHLDQSYIQELSGELKEAKYTMEILEMLKGKEQEVSNV